MLCKYWSCLVTRGQVQLYQAILHSVAVLFCCYSCPLGRKNARAEVISVIVWIYWTREPWRDTRRFFAPESILWALYYNVTWHCWTIFERCFSNLTSCKFWNELQISVAMLPEAKIVSPVTSLKVLMACPRAVRMRRWRWSITNNNLKRFPFYILI